MPSISMQIPLHNPVNHDRLALFHGQLSFSALIAGKLHFYRPIADRRTRAVEEALPRVLAHSPQGMFPVLLTLVLVEHTKDPSNHLAGRVIAGLLSNRQYTYPVFLQLAFIETKFK